MSKSTISTFQLFENERLDSMIEAVELVNIPLLPVSGRLGREEAIAIALREYNLSRPAWESFKTLEQLELGNALWVIERAYQLRGV